MLDDIEQTAYQLLSKLALREPHSVREVSSCEVYIHIHTYTYTCMR